MTQATQLVREPNGLLVRYLDIRNATLRLCEPLQAEDYVVQSMADVSPTKWHLAHTTWFFETFVLKPFAPNYKPLNERYAELFNSYYESVGPMHARDQRGLLSRPTVDEIREYRSYVDEHIANLLEGHEQNDVVARIELGLHHEQQHQELMLADIKHVFSCNPLAPAYLKREVSAPDSKFESLSFTDFRSGIELVGANDHAFRFDNETPRHQVLLRPFSLADRLTTNSEYRTFISEGGYSRAEFWLADGWSWIKQHGISRPIYWREDLATEFTLQGDAPLMDAAPVCHLSFYEADAFARWADKQYPGARLPSEQEWEVAAREVPIDGNFVESGLLHPSDASRGDGLRQMFGDVWEWTASPYSPYPGYRAAKDALGEYNGKFMCNQFVLRGGSCVTPATHIRSTYRNFFPSHARWQFTGLRLARDL